MANEQKRCPIWRTNVRDSWGETRENVQTLVVSESQRAGGDYRMTIDAFNAVLALDDDRHKAKLTTMLLDMRQQGDKAPLVTPQLIEEARRADPLPVYVRAERLLRYLTQKTQYVGLDLYSGDILNDLEARAWSESINPYEIEYFINYFAEMKWLEPSGSGMFIITVSGYEHIAEQARKTDSSQCFIAMWIDDSMNSVLEEGIEKAVKECGYTPRRIDKKHHFNKICDEAIAEIRRSRFVVADFTHGDDGARGSVFYEAGFAHALGLPIIFSCRKDQKLHFDTRQYTHILWKDEEDLYTQLREKIGALIGDYKAEPTHSASEAGI